MNKLTEKPQYPTTDPALESYALAHSSPETAVMRNLVRSTHFASIYPGMLSGHIQGLFLKMVSHMVRPERIIEIGTFTGFSAIHLAEGLGEGGMLYTIDNNPEMEETALHYFREAGHAEKIRMLIGEALEIIPALNETFDLAFIDADKENYSNYFDMLLPRVRSGGFILVDNVLWYGRVIDPAQFADKETQGVIEFNKKVLRDPRVETVMLPFRDGISVIRKL